MRIPTVRRALANARAIWYYSNMKKALATIVIVLTTLLLAATLFGGCSLLTPSAPKLEYDNVAGIVHWNKVIFAGGYDVKVVDTESGKTVAETSTSATQYAISDYGTFVVTVTATSSRGNSEPASITVVRVNTQTEALVDWKVSGAAALADMPVVPFFQNYYFPGSEVRVPINAESVPKQVASSIDRVLGASEWGYDNGCVVLYDSALAALDPGQHAMYHVALSDGTMESFRVDRVDSAAATVALYSVANAQDVKISVAPSPVSVLVEGTEANWSYDDDEVIVAASTFAHYEKETVSMQLVFEDGTTIEEFVLVSDTAAEVLSIGGGACLTYDKTTGGDITIGIGNSSRRDNASSDSYYYNVAVDGKLIDVGSSYTDVAAFSANRDVLTIKEEYLLSLGRGAHKVEIFTRDGVATAYLYVYSRYLMCYDLELNYDESWPDVVLEYKCDMLADEFVVCVGDAEYSSKDYPEMFEEGRVTLTGKIQKNDPVWIKSIYQGELAISEQIAFTADLDALEKYLDPEQGYTWLGEKVNLYIDSEEELENLAQYMLLYYDDLEVKSFYLEESGGNAAHTELHYVTAYFDFDALGFSQSMLLNKISGAEGAFTSYKEAYKLKAAVKQEDGVEVNSIGILLHSATEPTIAPGDRQDFVKYTESEDNEFHLSVSDRGANFDDFPIEKRTKTAVVKTSDQLFFAVEQGYKPVPVPGSAAERIYEKALDVCRTYIDDDMTDAEKVHAIYDWMGKNVVYDHSVAEEMEGVNVNSDAYNVFYKYNCFFLEGVFDDGVAVCNGIAKAVTLLCGIEDITCLKVGGTSRGVKHAWNKVLVDGVWYVVDSTWSNVKVAGDTVERFGHDYLMLSTPEAATNHKEDTDDTLPYYAPDSDYNYFVETYFKYGEYIGNYYISSEEELERLVRYAAAEGIDTVFVFCESLADLRAYAEAAGVTIAPCCSDFADLNGDAVCDNCRSESGVAVTVNGV